MKRLVLILAFFTFCGSLLAFEGRVLFEDGSPVRDATVAILGYPGSSRTDGNGYFTWSPNPPVPFEVLVVMPGGQYMAPFRVEELPPDGPVVVRVTPLVAESITVTAAVTPNIEASPASGMSVVPQEAIEVHHPVRLTDAVQNVPGSGQLSDLHAAVPSLRGLARGRTLLLIDGARVTTERRAGASATFLDPFFLEGIEVSRGPGSVGYGSDAFGGVIHARTRHPEPGKPTTVRFRGSLGAGLPEKSAGIEFLRGFDEGGVVLQARYRDFNEYRSPEGTVVNSQASDKGFLGRVGHELGEGMINVGWQTDFGRLTGRPDTRADTRLISYPSEDSHRLTVSYDFDPQLGFTRLGLVGFLGYYRLVTDRDELPTETSNRKLTYSDIDSNDFSFRGIAARPVGGNARLEFGLDINGRFNLEALNSVTVYSDEDSPLSTFEQTAIENAKRNDTAAYASTEVVLESRISASAGLRFDHITTRNQGGFFGDESTANDSFSGFGSLTAELATGLNLTGQVANGFRDPTLSARYYTGISGRGVITGNPDLEPESSLQYDLALRYVRSGLRWAVYGYYYRIKDLIERYEDGEDQFFWRNRGRARLMGLELELQSEIGKDISIEIGAQVADGKTLDDDEPLDDIPVENLTLQVRKNLGIDNYIQVRAALYGRDEEPGPTERVTPGYGILDLGAGLRLSSHFQLRVMIRNLLDTAYPVSSDRRAVLAPGINGIVTLIGDF
jgi:outer membrane receptor protein involved in Fe transport